jgi:excisionase family DNA binding protein
VNTERGETLIDADFITVKEAAKRLALSTRTIHRLLDVGDLPSVSFGRQRRIPAVDFDAWVQARVEDARGAAANRKVLPFG